MLQGAEVSSGIPGDYPDQLRRLVRGSRRLRFVQATAAGAGQQAGADPGTALVPRLRLDGLYDGGHGVDQLAESLDWPGFAGDVDAGV